MSQPETERGWHQRQRPAALPPGRLIHAEGGTQVLWISDGPAPDRLWAAIRAEHDYTGLWPLLLGALNSSKEGDFRPWCSGELSLRAISPPGRHDPAALLAEWWEDNAQDLDDEEDEGPLTAPYGQRRPGRAPAPAFTGDPDIAADTYAEMLPDCDPSMRLGLVAAASGADALAVCGWTGPPNFTNDTGEIAAVGKSASAYASSASGSPTCISPSPRPRRPSMPLRAK
ncbi:hypothetical protein OG417_16400 [Actinoallomurus sp. NBC_01490]|uniref:hypothetical protein n=1 Tax=Actinoallomurus sp. NBC_01490 TaxID=2903557 RepID=UPI002E33AAF1|nr:hypothetical protein [Actinoallomurus sp. NBC_01490]